MEKLMVNCAQELRGSKVVYQFQEVAPSLTPMKDWVGASLALLANQEEFKMGKKYKLIVVDAE